MDITTLYPRKCRRSVRRLVDETGMSEETAYASILLTAALADLHPTDELVVNMILEDCGISPECA